MHPGQITNLGSTNYFFLLQNQKQKAAPNYSKMVSPLTACTPSIQMAVSQYQCCVTWPRTVEVGPFFRDVWTALLTSIVTGKLTKRGSEVLAASSGSETTIFTVWRMLMITYAEYKTFKVADEADNYRLTLGEYNGTAGDSFTQHRYYK